MAYSELIKDFNRIRDYMRQFYVYGFKTRDEYDSKSARSYDNERRRIESWLSEYMSFRQEPAGKVAFITVDSSKIQANPLFNAFKAKSFTANDIVLHFCILDILQPGIRLSVSEITEQIDERYMAVFEDAKLFDEATVRNKLKEYAESGILIAERDGRRMLYRRAEGAVDLGKWKEAVEFFSEADPVGVIGSFLLDRRGERSTLFSYKHHYILHALESDIICTLLDAITDEKDMDEMLTFSGKTVVTTGLDVDDEEFVKKNVESMGGTFKPRFVKSLDVLVFDPQYTRETVKMRNTQELIEKGSSVKIVTFTEFCKLITGDDSIDVLNSPVSRGFHIENGALVKYVEVTDDTEISIPEALLLLLGRRP